MHWFESPSQTATLRERGKRETPAAGVAPHRHAVQFYEQDEFLSEAVADFASSALDAGDVFVSIATPAHQQAFARVLEGRGTLLPVAAESARAIFVDARTLLDSFMRDEMPDAAAFRASVGPLITAAAARSKGSVYAYGEMVDLLWRDGKITAAVRLEELWNELARQHDFVLLCAYAMENFADADRTDAFRDICGAHSHVLPTERYAAHDELGVLREVTRPQQRARAPETEMVRRQSLETELLRTVSLLQTRETQLEAALARHEALLEAERAARLEAERARSSAEQANRAKSQFLAVMSHELRTPLNAIGGYSELLELGVHGAITHEQRQAIDRIQRNQRHLLGLINEVLNYARLESGNLRYEITPVVVDEALRGSESLIFPQLRSKRLQFTYASCGSDVMVLADGDRLEQVVLNLLTNAVKFTDSGGHVQLSCESRDGWVLIAVRDTGVGIPAAKLEAIFDPFVQVDTNYTRTREGIGLGLAISRDLARGMGGDLTVESTVGFGSTFTLALPRHTG
jgi:signal transduction histidine kinase